MNLLLLVIFIIIIIVFCAYAFQALLFHVLYVSFLHFVTSKCVSLYIFVMFSIIIFFYFSFTVNFGFYFFVIKLIHQLLFCLRLEKYLSRTLIAMNNNYLSLLPPSLSIIEDCNC